MRVDRLSMDCIVGGNNCGAASPLGRPPFMGVVVPIIPVDAVACFGDVGHSAKGCS